MPKYNECPESMLSIAIPDHTHTCIGSHDEGADHFCGGCCRWWGKKA